MTNLTYVTKVQSRKGKEMEQQILQEQKYLFLDNLIGKFNIFAFSQ
jgi:hypothetical protein